MRIKHNGRFYKIIDVPILRKDYGYMLIQASIKNFVVYTNKCIVIQNEDKTQSVYSTANKDQLEVIYEKLLTQFALEKL
jgi:hypothetical protein